MTDTFKLLAGMGGLLAIFTAVIFWSVKAQVAGITREANRRSDELQNHIDEKLGEFSNEMKVHRERLDGHELKLHDQEKEQLRLRNEMLESMRTGYVRHDDIVKINDQIAALFTRLDKVIFSRKGGSQSDGH